MTDKLSTPEIKQVSLKTQLSYHFNRAVEGAGTGVAIGTGLTIFGALFGQAPELLPTLAVCAGIGSIFNMGLGAKKLNELQEEAIKQNLGIAPKAESKPAP